MENNILQVHKNLNEVLGLKKDKVFRTSIDAYDEFDNIIFTKLENNVVLSGALMTLEKLFNVRSPLNISTLNTIMGINTTSTSLDPGVVLPVDDFVCLWGIGVGGAGDSLGSVRPVNFYEREIGSNGNSSEMVPFRVVSSPLVGTEADTYYFQKQLNGGNNAYYLKKFETDPVLKVLWKDGAVGEDGSEVTSDVYNTSRSEDIEVLAEIILKLNKKDVREYFNLTGNIDKCHINTIALCAGIKKEISSGVYDYSDVRMITKLNFGNELLANKEITFRYRVYTN